MSNKYNFEKPLKVSGIDSAFGLNSCVGYIPAYEDISDEFKSNHNVYNKFISKWFFNGLEEEDLNKLKPKENIDLDQGLAHIASVMRSFNIKHEHKEAGCAFLLSNWFVLENN